MSTTSILKEGRALSASGTVTKKTEGYEEEKAYTKNDGTKYPHPEGFITGSAIGVEYRSPLTLTLTVLAGVPTFVVQVTVTAYSTVIRAFALYSLAASVEWHVKELTEAVIFFLVAVTLNQSVFSILAVRVKRTVWLLLTHITLFFLGLA